MSSIDSSGAIPYLAAMIRPILLLPNPLLRKKSAPVARVDKEVRKLAEDMFQTMYDAPGVGLAAVQIGVAKRVVTVDATRGEEAKHPIALVNPELVWSSDEAIVHEEGCLSIPEITEEVERPAQVRVRYVDLDGREQLIEAEGLLARVLQHEIDHTNGVLFIDHISKLKRDRVIKKYTKMAKQGAD